MAASNLLLLPVAELRAGFALGNLAPELSWVGALIFIARWSPPAACAASAAAGVLAWKSFRRGSTPRGHAFLVLAAVPPIAALALLRSVEAAFAFPPSYVSD
jgi:hypothetical protein